MSNDKIKISGIAVKEGTSRNKRKYIAKELNKFAPTLIGRPILKDHEGITDNVIGKITSAESLDEGKIVTYEGWVKEDGTGLIEKFKDGRISEVSIGAMAGKIVKDKDDDSLIIPLEMEGLELSTTPVPGNRGTSLFINPSIGEEIDMSETGIKNMIEDYSNSHSTDIISDLDKIKKEDIMESKEQKTVEDTNDKSIELMKSMKEELETLKKQNESLEDARISDAIVRYEEKAKAKGLKVKDLSKASLEMIKFATEMADEVPEPETEVDEPEKDKPTEDAEVEDEKPEAEPVTKEPEAEDDSNDEKFKGYVITTEDVSKGYAFYKYY